MKLLNNINQNLLELKEIEEDFKKEVFVEFVLKRQKSL